MALHLPAIVTLLALLLFVYSFLAVGMARKKYGVAAPATTGHAAFEVVYRVQMNTLEQLVLFCQRFGCSVTMSVLSGLGSWVSSG